MIKQVKTQPLGKIITGDVLDVNPKHFEKELKRYDSQLYLRWNPNKLKGWGNWEIRRIPNMKSLVKVGQFQGYTLMSPEYVELDIVSHVLDVAILNYKALEKIKSMDTFGDKNWVANLDYKAKVYKEEHDRKAKQELKYSIQQHKKEWRDFAKAVSEGLNPGQVLSKIKF